MLAGDLFSEIINSESGFEANHSSWSRINGFAQIIPTSKTT
jgi:hypothetical protein